MNNLDFSKYSTYKIGEKYEKGESRNLHQEIVDKFLVKLNEERTREKNLFRYREWLIKNKIKHSPVNILLFSKSKDCYKPLTFAFLSKLLSSYNNHDKSILYSQCLDSKCFSSLFWFKIKKSN